MKEHFFKNSIKNKHTKTMLPDKFYLILTALQRKFYKFSYSHIFFFKWILGW